MFIASTKEAIDNGWLLTALEFAEERLEEQEVSVNFLPWNVAFGPGDMTAQKLISFSNSVGAAIVVLTGDDKTTSRGEEADSPRDNLVFESGLFLSHLGLDRVLLLKEKGSKIPSDLLGVTLVPFRKPPDGEAPSDVAVQELGRKICNFVQDVFTKPSQVREIDSSVTRAITRSLERVDAESTEVRDAISGRARHGDPIQMPDAPTAYVDAVNEVNQSFLATTYLDSAFWTMRHLPVLEANEQLVERLSKGGIAKRMILLPRSIEEEIKAQRERRRSLRSGHPKMVEQMDQEFSAFEKSNMDLVDSGFDVKVVYDHGELWRYLPEGMHFSSGDSELAVFDEDRIDIYSGFTKNGLPSARVFGRTTHRSFKTIYDMTINYVNGLWESPYAEDFASFAKELGSVIEENQYELDYEPNWLLKYDDDADQGDARLKQEELTFVIESLAGGGNGSSIERHLDLGTCTGRYLAALREHLEIGVSIGVDLDSDCIEHCKRKHRDALKNERRFRIMDADIRDSESLPGENFDLITCMMGTLCHLRRESSTGGPYEDPWQEGLHNLAVRLAKDGDAFVAIWNTDSLPGSSTPSLLSIYPRRSTEILLKQSPAKNEFEARLEQANLKAVSHSLIEKRLHVYHLQHASR